MQSCEIRWFPKVGAPLSYPNRRESPLKAPPPKKKKKNVFSETPPPYRIGAKMEDKHLRSMCVEFVLWLTLSEVGTPRGANG